MRQFRDRREAGRLLGEVLAKFMETEELAGSRGISETLVLALPRGGVPVGMEVALALNAPLEVFIVRKLGLPGNPELAMGAIASGGACLLNHELIHNLAVPPEVVQSVIEKEKETLKSREIAYGVLERKADLALKRVILVDDGAATGATMRVAVQALRRLGVPRIIVGLPTASSQAAGQLRMDADEVVTLVEAEHFPAVGLWYEDFEQTGDKEVLECLQKAAQAIGAQGNT